MKILAGVLIAAALAFGSGCARSDWIDRTLVTVDVTGVWTGNWGGTGAGGFRLELEQQGSKVKGVIRFAGNLADAGPIDGMVAGDVFRFKDKRGGVEGELTVSGDEMIGLMSGGAGRGVGGSRSISLKRVDSSSRPGSLPR
jgi:hypothetical protein